jgi:putative endonuclease
MPSGFVYMLASKRNGTLYTGVTANVPRRMLEHKEGRGSEFVRKYDVMRLVWFEEHPLYVNAIQREKHQALEARLETCVDRKDESGLG